MIKGDDQTVSIPLSPQLPAPQSENSLPDFVRDQTISADCFRRLLKTYLFTRY